MLSFWERQSFLKYDYIVIGGGIVGLSTAISIKENKPTASVLILERGTFPTGASTKNAGFACFGSLTEILADIESMGETACLSLVDERISGLIKLRNRLGDNAIDYREYGGYELISEQEQQAMGQIEYVNRLLRPLFKANVFVEKKELVKEFRFNSSLINTVIYNPFEGQLDTGKMMSSLIQYAENLNIRVYTGTEVMDVSDEGSCVKLEVFNAVNKNNFSFQAEKVALCTNAFTNKLFPRLRIKPGRGLVLVTDPIPALPFKGTFHMDEGFYYFRNFEDRVIFGGGRNLDFEKESTTAFEINDMILSSLKEKLSHTILPTVPYKIDMIWSGIMAFGPDKKPIIEKISKNIVAGVGLGGMGVAIGTNVGEKISKMLQE